MAWCDEVYMFWRTTHKGRAQEQGYNRKGVGQQLFLVVDQERNIDTGR